ncbi:hypothetical protein [Labedaea rhizosphaerae]|uniref:HK97 gp10 family phage protein n=1 Tax=Labedaea rhizosphaerae TaxID=598644 RepID=A0A4R6SEY7_LABRH|nr:hypothetical protein [Labedaea rhizosphaerae]TDP97646.1 hypothetical protein EV186_103610 [Labedaea rhizosphaerae]
MAGKTAITLTVRIDGVQDTLKAFRQLPKEASAELRDASQRIAVVVAAAAKSNAQHEGPQARLVARTIKVLRDRVPVIVAGGTMKLGRNNAPAWGLVFGAEFGQNARSGWYAAMKYDGSIGRQWHPHRGRQGYFLFPTVESRAAQISREWNAAADGIQRAFGGDR